MCGAKFTLLGRFAQKVLQKANVYIPTHPPHMLFRLGDTPNPPTRNLGSLYPSGFLCKALLGLVHAMQQLNLRQRIAWPHGRPGYMLLTFFMLIKARIERTRQIPAIIVRPHWGPTN